jgi:endonuclease VIII
MPEGPSIVILKEAVDKFTGQPIIKVDGNSKLDIQLIQGQKVKAFLSWGKHFLIVLDDFTIRIHFLLFGSYSVDEKVPTKLTRLGLHFANGSIYFYACSVQFINEDINRVYDWTADVMNPRWSKSKAKTKLQNIPNTLVCDALLDQNIFAGVGNIIKNEVCYRIRVHPESLVGALPPRQLNDMLREARRYSFDFLEWKKRYVLRKHWLAHTKTVCVRCDLPIIKKYCGKTNRRTFFCTNCQKLYS